MRRIAGVVMGGGSGATDCFAIGLAEMVFRKLAWGISSGRRYGAPHAMQRVIPGPRNASTRIDRTAATRVAVVFRALQDGTRDAPTMSSAGSGLRHEPTLQPACPTTTKCPR
jgi:hypothetical protein